MAPISTSSFPPKNELRASDRNEKTLASKHPRPFSIEPPMLGYLSTTADQGAVDVEITYPEGGRDAWLVVFGAWCGLTASLGIYNTAGIFEVVISEALLPEVSPSTLGWIFSVYAFVNWLCGVQVGPTFDAMGSRSLITGGTICTLIGIFSLSFCTSMTTLLTIYYIFSKYTYTDFYSCFLKSWSFTNTNTEYYQMFLAFSIMTGIGSSLLITPSIGCVAHWFMKRRGFASGIAFIGAGFGGVLFPLVIQSLLPLVGWR